MRYRTYTLRVEQTDGALVLGTYDEEELQRVIQIAEEVVSDGLPEGYYCKIDEVRDASQG